MHSTLPIFVEYRAALVESVWKRFWENEENNVKRVVGPLWKKIIFASDIIIGLQIL